MDERIFTRKITGMLKGSKVAIIPLSVDYGDEITAIGIPGSFSSENPVELKDPFEAFLEDFDGEVLRLRTPIHYCLKVSIGDIKDVMALTSETWKEEEMPD